MLFTAPAFVFLFLPLAVIFCALFHGSAGRVCLAAVCLAYFFLANASTPLGMLVLPALVLYSFLAGRLAARVRSRVLAVVLTAFPIACLLVLRGVTYFGLDGVAYPVGITVPTLSAAAYVKRCASKGDGGRLLSLWQYLSFFPIMLVGPFVTYDDFGELMRSGKTRQELSVVSEGIGLYALGFIKRIAIGAVLVDGYGKIFAYSWESPSAATVLLLITLIYFGVFFSLSGYYDMAVGISKMLGVNLERVRANPLAVATVNEYSRGLFSSVRAWTDECVLAPLGYSGEADAPRVLKAALYSLLTVACISIKPGMLLLAVPLCAFSLASSALGLDGGRSGSRAGLRVVFGMLTVVVVGAAWVLATMGVGSANMLEYLTATTVGNAEYQTDMVLISFSGRKYLFVAVLAFVISFADTRIAERLGARLPRSARAVADYGKMALLLVAFAFTVLFFLPQFEVYCERPFAYITV